MTLLELIPPNTVEKFSRYFVNLGETGQTLYFNLQLFLFLALTFLVALSFFRRKVKPSSRAEEFVSGDTLFIIVATAYMIVSRMPLVVEGYLNPDEALWIAIAKTLVHDPRYWVSVDGGTGGPLVPGSLLVLNIFGIPIDFGSIKIVTGIMMTLSVISLYKAFTYVFNGSFA
ncbi:MAG TPA: hypothetical protein VG737_15525, partial [Cyclobacteriaceae bacterium]|nr:hypothetical protein [Cyclobacteriaceae bacterium]